jgi:hypothetical protein
MAGTEGKNALVIQALRYLGQDNIGPREIEMLRNALSPAEKRKLMKDARFGADWIYETAKRLAGAIRHIGRPAMADQIVSTMKAAGDDVRESDPFAERAPAAPAVAAAPIVGRVQAMWASMRGVVRDIFPPPPGLPTGRNAFLHFVDEIYRADAYHSLSIEGYTVSPDLIERVRGGDWNPDNHDSDWPNRDALAARGYWQAFQIMKANVGEIIAGMNPGLLGPYDASRLVSRAFPALCRSGPDSAIGARRLSQQCRISAHVALCASEMGGRARRDARFFRFAGE